jgi:hypothetical protein
MDVHKDAIAVAVRNAAGKVVRESILETKAATMLQFIRGRRGNRVVTFEEGIWAAGLYLDLWIQPSKWLSGADCLVERQLRHPTHHPANLLSIATWGGNTTSLTGTPIDVGMQPIRAGRDPTASVVADRGRSMAGDTL